MANAAWQMPTAKWQHSAKNTTGIIPEDLVVFGGRLLAVPALGMGWAPIWVQQGDGSAPRLLLHDIGHTIYSAFELNIMVDGSKRALAHYHMTGMPLPVASLLEESVAQYNVPQKS
ncbi:hypothetical protein BV20DRAFT_980660 [Pilatotrama ljubarskyi]|nr:hypothetical protein BV20DRAFT_980660 [Pilatotrama ljubarskyi]